MDGTAPYLGGWAWKMRCLTFFQQLPQNGVAANSVVGCLASSSGYVSLSRPAQQAVAVAVQQQQQQQQQQQSRIAVVDLSSPPACRREDRVLSTPYSPMVGG